MSLNYNDVDIVQLISDSFSVINHTQNTKTTVEHDSLIIWPATNTFKWFSNGIGGGPYQWLKYVINLHESEMEEYVKGFDKVLLIDEEEDSAFSIRYPVGHISYNDYIKSRNITPKTSKHFGVEVWLDNIIIPLYTVKGNRCGSLVRSTDPSATTATKYRKIMNDTACSLWPHFLFKERFDKPVIVFEGCWSAMRWWQVSEGSVIPLALTGTNITDEVMEILNNIPNVTFILDNDKKSNAGKLVMNRVKANKFYDKSLNWRFIMPSEYPDEMSDKLVKWYLKRWIKCG